jgi:hypothetical protein
MEYDMPLTFTDEAIAELIEVTMHYHHDMDVHFADHARHIVAALRANGLLADAALDVEGVRHELDRLTVLGRETLGDRFSFITVSIWSHKDRGPDGFTIYIHGAHNGPRTQAFHEQDPAAAFRAAEAWLKEHDPAALEAEGWATLGATVAP